MRCFRPLSLAFVLAGLTGALPRSLDGQARWVVAAGAHRATVGTASPVLGLTTDFGYRLSSSGGFLSLRMQWWDTVDPLAAIGLYYGGRSKKWRFIYVDLGIAAIRAESAAGRATVRPAVGLTVAGVLDIANDVKLRVGGAQLWESAQLWDSDKAILNLGVSICICP